MHRVWVVEAGDKYEGWTILNVFKRQGDAIKFAREREPDYAKWSLDVLVTMHEVK